MKVLVCGGRDYRDRARLFAVLDCVHETRPIELIIAGGARGADSLAVEWAGVRGIETCVFQAEWESYWRSAGPKRNQRMIDEGKPNMVIAFPGGAGTSDMIRKATLAGVDVVKVK